MRPNSTADAVMSVSANMDADQPHLPNQLLLNNKNQTSRPTSSGSTST